MSATDTGIKTSGGKPIPQWYNPSANQYEEAPGDATNGGYFQANDGALKTVGAKADTAATSSSGSFSVVALLKAIFKALTVGPTTTVLTTAAASTSAVTLLVARADRRGAAIYNDSSARLYLKLGASPSISSFTALLDGNGSGLGGYYEVPATYTGDVTGVWASATGSARVTEIS